MRRTLLEGAVIDVIYYTHLLTHTTLQAAGDCEFIPYLLLADAVTQPQASTPRELASRADIDRRLLESAADYWESEGLLQRTRSPRDHRSVAFTPTLMGAKHTTLLNELLFAAYADFWRSDSQTVLRLVTALEPFCRTSASAFPVNDRLPISLRFLCALHALWKSYSAFSHASMLSFSEMHMMLLISENGAIPNHPLLPDRNYFATMDYRTSQSLIYEKKLLKSENGKLSLTKRGMEKASALYALCERPTRNKDEGDSSRPAVRLSTFCRTLTQNATRERTESHLAKRDAEKALGV